MEAFLLPRYGSMTLAINMNAGLFAPHKVATCMRSPTFGLTARSRGVRGLDKSSR